MLEAMLTDEVKTTFWDGERTSEIAEVLRSDANGAMFVDFQAVWEWIPGTMKHAGASKVERKIWGRVEPFLTLASHGTAEGFARPDGYAVTWTAHLDDERLEESLGEGLDGVLSLPALLMAMPFVYFAF